MALGDIATSAGIVLSICGLNFGMIYWLDWRFEKRIDGFKGDLTERLDGLEHSNGEEHEEPHKDLKELRTRVDQRDGFTEQDLLERLRRILNSAGD